MEWYRFDAIVGLLDMLEDYWKPFLYLVFGILFTEWFNTFSYTMSRQEICRRVPMDPCPGRLP